MTRCETCRFWKPLSGGEIGECRESPPVIVEKLIYSNESGDQVPAATRFPMTTPTTWCGCYERKE